MVHLQKLWLNRNFIMVVEPLRALKKLNTLGLFHNEISNENKAWEVFEDLPALRDLSIDGNPVSAKASFKYELIMRLRLLDTLDDEPIQELDRDVAEQFFVQNRSKALLINLLVPLPGQSALKK